MKNNAKTIFILLIFFLMLGCQPKRPDIKNVVKSGVLEEHVQYQDYPIYNCQSDVANTVIARRSRTLEQSIAITGNVEFGKEKLKLLRLEELTAKIGFSYGVTNSVTITDGGDLQMTAAPHSYPVYNIAWKESWEDGYVVVKYNNEEKQVAYQYLQFARPEIRDIEYETCDSLALTATALASISTPLPTPTQVATNTQGQQMALLSIICIDTSSSASGIDKFLKEYIKTYDILPTDAYDVYINGKGIKTLHLNEPTIIPVEPGTVSVQIRGRSGKTPPDMLERTFPSDVLVLYLGGGYTVYLECGLRLGIKPPFTFLKVKSYTKQ